jgi:hypothetical protein
MKGFHEGVSAFTHSLKAADHLETVAATLFWHFSL